MISKAHPLFGSAGALTMSRRLMALFNLPCRPKLPPPPPAPRNRVVACGDKLLVVVEAVRNVEATAKLIAQPATVKGEPKA